ncbi:MAG: RnfABCDGE type electron transport complex subunit B [Stenotrophobium sp.]
MKAAAALAERIEQIDRLLPQTQCTQCGYPACKPYAAAIACGEVDTNQCPPGGDEGVARLAALLGRATKAINPANGIAKTRQTVAVIDEAVCIGCTLCIQACPVDAIVGANQLMHTVIAGECSGCELCLPPCPVDCIRMDDVPETRDIYRAPQTIRQFRADAFRSRFEARQQRLERDKNYKEEMRARKKAAIIAHGKSSDPSEAPLTGAARAPVYDPVATALALARAKKS